MGMRGGVNGDGRVSMGMSEGINDNALIPHST